MKRREFIAKSAAFAGALALPRIVQGTARKQAEINRSPSPRIFFKTSDAHYQSVYQHALDVLANNTTVVSGDKNPVLIEGSNYHGIWLECGPQEGLVYSLIRPDIAHENHLIFFDLQRDDGQLPCWVRTTAAGFGQIQMVVPIAATAWELSKASGDSELLEKAYAGSSRWDAWLRRYRDTRKTGLCEGFCTWDTGHDNSPRWAGIPNSCPNGDARQCPPVDSLPRLCPDLSATVYGGRIALAAMARALGKNSETDHWLEYAETIRAAIIKKLYSSEDAAFYDLDAHDHWVRIRGDVISRVLGEHVADQSLFENIYQHQIHNPEAFWTPYPLPSIALNDPSFVRPIPRNSWGCASQALTALRAPRWMEHYGKPADLAHLMQQWISAIAAEGKFLQQMDPMNGQFTPDVGDYSPAALVFIDFTWRLAGVREVEGGIEWNVRPTAQNVRCSYRLQIYPALVAELKYSNGRGELKLNGKLICQTSNTVRLITDRKGKIKKAVGISTETTKIELEHGSGRKHHLSIEPNTNVKLEN